MPLEAHHRIVLKAPIAAIWHVSDACRRGCAHCANTERVSGRPRPAALKFRISARLKRTGVFSLTIGGGEPYAFYGLSAAIRGLLSAVPRIVLCTSGSLADRPDLLRLAAAHQGRLGVQLSVTASAEGSGGSVAGDGVFAVAAGALKKFQAAGVDCSINYTLTRSGCRNLEALFDLAEKYSIGQMRFGRPIPSSPSHLPLVPRSEQLNSALDRIVTLSERLPATRVHLPRCSRRNKAPVRCDAATRMVILPSGDITDCFLAGSGRVVLGNILTHSPAEIWQRPPAVRRRARIDEIGRICDGCRRNDCPGVCAAILDYRPARDLFPADCPRTKELRCARGQFNSFRTAGDPLVGNEPL